MPDITVSLTDKQAATLTNFNNRFLSIKLPTIGVSGSSISDTINSLVKGIADNVTRKEEIAKEKRSRMSTEIQLKNVETQKIKLQKRNESRIAAIREARELKINERRNKIEKDKKEDKKPKK